jgi:hypothetical protein
MSRQIPTLPRAFFFPDYFHLHQRAFRITTSGIEGGQSLAIAAKEMERVRKTLVEQLKEFDSMKKSLLKDLQNRCEKVRFPLFH